MTAMHGVLLALTLLTGLGCGLAAGVFFAFSSFVMKALGRLPPAAGIAAMQSVNAAAVTPVFMTTLFGTAAAGAVLAVWGMINSAQPYAAYLLTGSALYLVGVIAVTAAYHVPRNNALDRVRPDSPDAAGLWARYLSGWTAGNHVRAVAALAALALFSLALTTS
jgi:uncharacterized membrane protein